MHLRIFRVFQKALAIRMKQLGLLKKEYLDNPFDLVTVYPEVSEL